VDLFLVSGTCSWPTAVCSFSRSMLWSSRSRKSGSARLFLSSSCCSAGPYPEASRVGTAVGVVGGCGEATAAGVGTSVGTAVSAASVATPVSEALAGVLKASGVGDGFDTAWKSATVWRSLSSSSVGETLMPRRAASCWMSRLSIASLSV